MASSTTFLLPLLALVLLASVTHFHPAHAVNKSPSSITTPQRVHQLVDPDDDDDDLPVDPEGTVLTCSNFGTRGFPPVTCPFDNVCVIQDFGNPPADIPDFGFCAPPSLVTPSPPACSLSQCALNGGSTICTLVRRPNDGIVPSTASGLTTCAAWATLSVVNRDNQHFNICDQFVCTADCPADAVSSLGQVFCNACNLQVAACRARFTFTGPIDVAAECSVSPPTDISPFLRAFCCSSGFDDGCVKEGGDCSTGGGLLPSTMACISGTTCVLSDLGFPALDRPNSGTCTKVDVDSVKTCTVKGCARTGKNGICRLPVEASSMDIDIGMTQQQQGPIVTCGAWASRTDGGVKPDCDGVSCKRVCAKRHWLKKCKKCLLVRKSCRAGFAFRVRW